MTLGQMQRLFAKNVGLFLGWIYGQQGYEVTFDEAYRTKEQAALNAVQGKGSANSLHCDRLAIDLNLFVNGVWQTQTEQYARLGTAWKQIHPLNRWGGDFTKLKDGNHFSMEWQGRQ